jgi:hypothetical protein
MSAIKYWTDHLINELVRFPAQHLAGFGVCTNDSGIAIDNEDGERDAIYIGLQREPIVVKENIRAGWANSVTNLAVGVIPVFRLDLGTAPGTD